MRMDARRAWTWAAVAVICLTFPRSCASSAGAASNSGIAGARAAIVAAADGGAGGMASGAAACGVGEGTSISFDTAEGSCHFMGLSQALRPAALLPSMQW